MALRDDDLGQRPELGTTDVSAKAADAVLVRAFQAGDPLAFPAIYERYRPLARHIAFRILRSPEEADETSQETMLRVYQGLNRFEGELRLQAWVARISANLALDTVRARSRRPARADRPVEEAAAHLPDPAQDPEALVARMLEDEEVRRVLATLPPHYRDALVMREYWGRSHAEIGSALGMTAPQAKALIHRAKGSFRRAWEAAGAGVAAFAPFVLTPFKRLFGHAADTASAAVHASQVAAAAPTLYLVPQVAQTAASSSGMAERIAAAGMAVLVAAGVGAGAVVVKDKVVDAPRPAAVVAAAPAGDETTAPAGAAGSTKGGKKARAASDAAVVAGGTDTVDPAAVTTDPAAGTADPASGTTDPAAGTVPTEAPAPVLSITSPIAFCEGCTVAWAPVSTSHAGSLADGDLRFTYRMLGTVRDAFGVEVEGWAITAQLSGSIVGGDGTARLGITLTTPEGGASWAGKGILAPKAGDASFSLAGTWALEAAGEALEGVPAGGTLAGTLGLWSDGASPTGLTLVLRPAV